MFNRKAYDDLDNALSKLDAFTKLISYLQDQDIADRQQLVESEGRVVEQMLAECHSARAAFEKCWLTFTVANDRRAS